MRSYSAGTWSNCIGIMWNLLVQYYMWMGQWFPLQMTTGNLEKCGKLVERDQKPVKISLGKYIIHFLKDEDLFFQKILSQTYQKSDFWSCSTDFPHFPRFSFSNCSRNHCPVHIYSYTFMSHMSKCSFGSVSVLLHWLQRVRFSVDVT